MCIEVIITVTCTHYISLNDVVCTQLHANVDHPTTQLTQDDAQKIQSNVVNLGVYGTFVSVGRLKCSSTLSNS